MKIVIGEGIVDQDQVIAMKDGTQPPVPTQRVYGDFIKAYLGYTCNQEASEKYQLWTALSIIAGALERKVYFKRSHFMIFPNLYILLVGPAGLVKKSTSTQIGVSILRDVATIKMMSQTVTDAALVSALRDSYGKYTENAGQEMQQSALYCYASELTTLLKDTHGIVAEYLTDLYDCQPHDHRQPWTRETKGEGKIKVFGPSINILSCATKTSLRDCIPASQMEAGLASRMLFVIENNAPKNLVPIPRHDPRSDAVRANLLNDLRVIHQSAGEAVMTKDAEAYFSGWYITYKTKAAALSDEAKFSGYYGRKDLMVQKLSIVASASASNDKIVTDAHVYQAIGWLDALEENMFNLFRMSGKNEDAGILIEMLNFIKKKKRVTEFEVVSKFVAAMPVDKIKATLGFLAGYNQVEMQISGKHVFYVPNPNAPDISDWKADKEVDIEY